MKTLSVSTGNFDQVNTFTIAEIPYSKCSLQRDYQTEGDGILWVMLNAGVLKSKYSAADKAEMDRLNSGESTVHNREIVQVDGKQYKIRVLGKYSDCAILDQVNA